MKVVGSADAVVAAIAEIADGATAGVAAEDFGYLRQYRQAVDECLCNLC